MRRFSPYLFVLSLLATCVACGRSASSSQSLDGDTITDRATLLDLVVCDDYVAVIVADPWHPGKTLAQYALVDSNTTDIEAIPNDFTIIRVPLERSLVYSSIHTSAIDDLDAIDAVAAVADGMYYTPEDTVYQLIASGNIVDIGNSISPNTERIIDINPDAVLVAPYENAGHGILDRLGIPIIECVDYMEPEPLARAEWILLLGYLYGNIDEAKAIYRSVCDNYNDIKQRVAQSPDRPVVLTELPISGVWYVPGGQSYMAKMLADAGARYPWADDTSSGSLQLDAAAVVDRAADADVWLMRTFGQEPTLQSLASLSPMIPHVKAHRTGRVFNCSTDKKPIFSDIAFRPDLILEEFASIFHPEIMKTDSLRYYSQIQAK